MKAERCLKKPRKKLILAVFTLDAFFLQSRRIEVG